MWSKQHAADTFLFLSHNLINIFDSLYVDTQGFSLLFPVTCICCILSALVIIFFTLTFEKRMHDYWGFILMTCEPKGMCHSVCVSASNAAGREFLVVDAEGFQEEWVPKECMCVYVYVCVFAGEPGIFALQWHSRCFLHHKSTCSHAHDNWSNSLCLHTPLCRHSSFALPLSYRGSLRLEEEVGSCP